MTNDELFLKLKEQNEELKESISLLFDPVLDLAGACELTGFSRQTMYAKTSSGTVPHYKQGGKLFFKRSELLAWLTAHPVRSREQVEAAAANLRRTAR